MAAGLLAGALGVGASLFGQSQANKNLKKGRAAQLNELMQGYDKARPEIEQGYDTASGYIDPYVQTGERYQKMYDDLMGLNGPEARAQAQQVITSDPLWTGALGQQQNAALRLLNSRGLGGSGASALAAQRVLNENYQPVVNRYQQGGAQGMAAAGAAADIARGKGESLGNLDYGYAQQRAGVEGNYYNARAQSAGALTNNLLGTAGMVIGGYTPNIAGNTAFGNITGALNKLWGAGAQAANPAAASSYTMPSSWGGVGAYPY